MEDRVINTSDLSHFEEQLKKFSPPKRGKDIVPHVLYGSWAMVYRPDANGTYSQKMEYQLRCMEFPVIAPSINKLAQYKGKGWVILDYYFPQKHELAPKRDKTERGFKAILRSADEDPYSEARAYCQSQKNMTYQLNADRKEISALKAELEQYKTKNSKPAKSSTQDLASNT